MHSTAVQILLKSVASKTGHVMTYNYDMTDPWSHIIEVTKIREGGENAVTKLTDGARAGIPEVSLFGLSIFLSPDRTLMGAGAALELC